eukprot:CAMPEP_0198346032 /NCGR_PEP_ID=MMETSP1450-20131203/77356_1 /TAXON_ID=753684 ORGANISM="Madagascaria erythrocladiodes, Strain CCMP3234" /NCGR_SAMPLE_ID=MMETSP1450 /ASSEMBLY_ACC=CAM_ASM_001115 /LENGTH=152 /DNA_ID=CAMNT_0044051423 /DNA_START=63 /DNA_END=521 /DNA_ORIENTATION=-
MIHFVMLVNRQGKVRLSKWFEAHDPADRTKVFRDVCNLVLPRSNKMSNVVEWRDMKIVYKRYASLYFVICIDENDNELMGLELIHLFVECLDKYFGNVCELDLIFNFHRAYYMLDEVIIAGELQDSNKRVIMEQVQEGDALSEKDPEFAKRR